MTSYRGLGEEGHVLPKRCGEGPESYLRRKQKRDMLFHLLEEKTLVGISVEENIETSPSLLDRGKESILRISFYMSSPNSNEVHREGTLYGNSDVVNNDT